MNPKYRPAIFIGMAFVLMAPYFGFVIYYSLRFPPNQWPTWFVNTITIWFIANFVALILLMRLTRRMFGNQVVDVGKSRAVADKAIRANTARDPVEPIFPLRSGKDCTRKDSTGARNSGRRFPVAIHRHLWPESIPCETSKGLSTLRSPPRRAVSCPTFATKPPAASRLPRRRGRRPFRLGW
jgi:hypothetical protein